MHKKFHLTHLFTWLVLAAALLAACGPAATAAPAPTTPPEPAATAVPPTATTAPAGRATTAPTAALPARGAANPSELILATTTSTQDSGLLDYLLPMFEQQFNAKIKVIAVGSGQALQLGKDGNADVLLVHSPAAEKTFMDNKDGAGSRGRV